MGLGQSVWLSFWSDFVDNQEEAEAPGKKRDLNDEDVDENQLRNVIVIKDCKFNLHSCTPAELKKAFGGDKVVEKTSQEQHELANGYKWLHAPCYHLNYF